MATTFVRRKPKAGWFRRALAGALAGAGVAGLTACAQPAHAETDFYTEVTAQGILSLLGFDNLVNNDGNFTDTNASRYGVITNEYFTVAHGVSGTFTWPRGTNYSQTHDVAGYLTFGNNQGNLRGALDDKQGLVAPYDRPLFPVPGRYVGTGNVVNYSSFVALNVDGTGNVLGTSGFRRRDERVNGALVSEMNSLTNVVVRQEIRLRRATARMQWTITNTDTVNTHSVGLQFVVNNDIFPYQVDPQRGATSRNLLFAAGNIPATFDLTDQRADPIYYSRHVLRGFDATPPDRLFVTDSRFWLTPGYYQPDIDAYPDPKSRATGVYWDPISLPPGSSRTIVTYFGNGSSSDLLNADFVTGVEAIESVAYNAEGINNLTDSQKTGATLGTGTAFLGPTPLTVFGSVYNQTLSDPEFQVPLGSAGNPVALSLIPPVGLRFAVVNSATGDRDTSNKAVGTIPGDTDARTSWSVEPTGEAYGALVLQMSVSVPRVGSRTVSRILNVPATPLRVLTNTDWNLISFPFAFDAVATNNSDVSTVLNTITKPEDLPGGVVPIYRWLPALNPITLRDDGRYERVTRVEPGVAYYYKPNLNRTVFLTGAVPVPNQAPTATTGNPTSLGTPFQTFLEPGWNMVGNPFLYDIPVAYLRIVPLENNPSLQSFTFAEAVGAGLLRGALYYYTGQTAEGASSYDFLQNLSDPLHPWVGYWVFVNNRANLIYSPPTPINTAVTGTTPTGLTATSQTLGAVASGRALVKNPTMEEWKLQLVARTREGLRDSAAFIGQSRAAKNEDDIRDLPKPPPFRNYVYVGIARTGTGTRYAQDMKAADGGSKTWDFEVVTDVEGSAVTLSWPNMATLPKRLRLKLTDLDSGRSINMRSASSYRVEAASKEVGRRFRITAEPGASRSLAISGLRTVPTGTGGGRGVAPGYRFDFNLTSDAVVTGRVLTLGGKSIRTLSAGRAAGVGANSIHWDGRGADGETLPAGPYQVEISARGDGGEIVKERRPVLLLR